MCELSSCRSIYNFMINYQNLYIMILTASPHEFEHMYKSFSILTITTCFMDQQAIYGNIQHTITHWFKCCIYLYSHPADLIYFYNWLFMSKLYFSLTFMVSDIKHVYFHYLCYILVVKSIISKSVPQSLDSPETRQLLANSSSYWLPMAWALMVTWFISLMSSSLLVGCLWTRELL